MTNKSVSIACVAAALALMLAGSAIALGSHQNQLTFNRPVSLPGVVLPAGSYTFDMDAGERHSVNLATTANSPLIDESATSQDAPGTTIVS